ncbi:hypothetical protein WHR41_09479 [Cladosporium halotolerans]|uniref:Alcohol dehydrogenase-like N-terminal domain-containing protein n=1 Tax=Cladosporium halotolerans TaxID=1052096 RepID=A0AB34KA85_9PEZI
MPALKAIHPEELRDDHVLIKVDIDALNASNRKHRYVPALIGHDEGCGVGCDYTGTVVQAGSKVSMGLREGDYVAVHTHDATSVGKDSRLDESSDAKGAGYYNKWERVSWSL